MTFPYKDYLRNEKLPLLWCPGCGDGIVLKAIIRAIHKLGWKKDDIAMVSGIGCSGRTPGYVDFNTLHTTHGRPVSFATGIKMVRPDKHVIVVSGDGDATAIGGNHFIHACRRNIDINLIVINNSIYGMTGGQFSPTTPIGINTSTTPMGNIDPAFDIGQLAIAAGATFVGRQTVAKGLMLSKMMEEGFAHNGMTVIDVIANCHTQYGRRNKLGDPIKLIKFLQDKAVPLRKAEKMKPGELEGKFVTGVLHKVEREEYTDAYERLIKEAKGQGGE
ncbi:MAG: 2-oxoglutarate ferredoxin oxidoreductase subunit beta [Nitrospinota bacterium]